MDLTDFLAARLAEDEAGAREAQSLWDDSLEIIAFQRHYDPARALREVEAKRARLALMIEARGEMDKLLAGDTAGRVDQAMAIGRARGATVAVKHDVAVWSDHPDYDEAWRP
jgi:hypothetical protein